MGRDKNKRQATWIYEGRNKKNDLVAGTIQAPTAIVAKVKLRKKKIIPLSINRRHNLRFIGRLLVKLKAKSPIKAKQPDLCTKFDQHLDLDKLKLKQSAVGKNKTRNKIKKPVKDKEITVFVKQFLVVIKSGVPLLKAFDIVIEGQENKKFVEILTDIKFGVENGLSLAESFGAYPQVFDALFINFLALGEQGGILEVLLLRYVEYRKKTEAVLRKVKAALAYPVIVLIVSILVLGVILGFVVPQFQKIFMSVGAALPAPTLAVVAISQLVINYWWLILGAIFLSMVLVKILYRNWPRFRFMLDSLIFKVPLMGKLIQKSLLSRWTRTLALLFAAGVPLNEALHSIALVVDNYLYGIATLNIQRYVEAGGSLAGAIQAADLFPNMVRQMAAVGEESGSLDSSLLAVADYYDQELEMTIETLLTLIEPATIVILGSILGAIIIAIYLPLFNLGNVVG